MPSDKVDTSTMLEFKCPFCGLKAWAGNQMVCHSLPMCPEFEKDTSPADFLQSVNAKLREN